VALPAVDHVEQWKAFVVSVGGGDGGRGDDEEEEGCVAQLNYEIENGVMEMQVGVCWSGLEWVRVCWSVVPCVADIYGYRYT